MLWINFLHLYQPANLEDEKILEAVNRSYERLAVVLEKNPETKFTLNITGCLLERIDNLGRKDLLERFARLAKNGQIELTGSAAYHPLLPLLPEKEIINQIKENEVILKKYFGDKLVLRGFFSPEMAYGDEVARIVKKMGYEWIILDEISATGKLNMINTESVYSDKNSGLKIIFRSRAFSDSYVPEKVFSLFSSSENSGRIVITATDAELYGLRHHDTNGELEKILKNKNIKTILLSDYLSEYVKNIIDIKPISSTWASGEDDLAAGEPYVLWRSPDNKIHKKLWRLANLALKAFYKFDKDKNKYWSRWHLVRGLASCTWWWASRHDFRHIFGPIAWSPDDVERGLNDLVRAVRSLDDPRAKRYKIKTEKLNAKIRRLLWVEHWDKN